MAKKEQKARDRKRSDKTNKLTIEELEKRIAPATADKKSPNPPPYAPGTAYGLVRRDNLTS